jgi:hypothetical protein
MKEDEGVSHAAKAGDVGTVRALLAVGARPDAYRDGVRGGKALPFPKIVCMAQIERNLYVAKQLRGGT